MAISPERITIRQPDDWHVHLRDDGILESVAGYTARVFRRAIIMPNLSPPITSVKSAIMYRERILNAVPEEVNFTPLMTIYLTDNLSPEVLEHGHKDGVFTAAKLYPANSTTNSSNGVSDLTAIDSLLATMERIDMPLLIHGEVTDSDVDVFDREVVFIERHLEPVLRNFPKLRVVLEHITTEQAVQFVENGPATIAATITPHHLHINRNAMFDGGIRSDFYCLPVAKREHHRLALRRAATSGKKCFFLGTDSAPHLRSSKETSCGCAGIFNAAYALESYIEVFEQEGALDQLESFTSKNGPLFYGLPLNQEFVTFIKRTQIVPERFELKGLKDWSESIVPFHAGEALQWTLLVE